MNKTIKCRPISLLIMSPILTFDVNELYMHTYLSPTMVGVKLRCDFFFKGYSKRPEMANWKSN